jgi:hypothetical protein
MSLTACLMLPSKPIEIENHPKVTVPLPLRPVYIDQEKQILKSLSPEAKRIIIKHEVEWNGYADKMELRVK